MMESLTHLIHMNGHGMYVWSAYGAVLTLLAVQWLIPWKRLKKQSRLRKPT